MNSPYRRGVGIFLFNDQGLIWIGRRREEITAETHLYEPKHLWQMPQGGIDEGEAIEKAARRELFEETGITNIDIVGQTAGWLRYDLPDHLVGKVLHGFKGQTQKWLAIRFLGNDQEINLQAHQPAEFRQWRWCHKEELTDLVIPFKANLYRQVIAELEFYLPV